MTQRPDEEARDKQLSPAILLLAFILCAPLGVLLLLKSSGSKFERPNKETLFALSLGAAFVLLVIALSYLRP